MCNLKLLKKTTHGALRFCPNCQLFQLSYKHLLYNFSATELQSFRRYINNIQSKHWLKTVATEAEKEKTPIITGQHNLLILIDREELLELRCLINKRKNRLLDSQSLGCQLMLN
jgi:hypothetical protein